jgi:hypothetical protein
MLAWARPTASENEEGVFGMVFYKHAALLELRMGTPRGGTAAYRKTRLVVLTVLIAAFSHDGE